MHDSTKIGLLPEEVRNLDVEVVVICSAYNQERYISDALDGFVSQKTEFSYIVLVHDDASLDGTSRIIREYERKYPDIIKGIYEVENQYRKGNYYWYKEYLIQTNAKYLALCEGDDYWIDEEKLQAQFDTLESDENGVFCFTNAMKISATDGRELGAMLPSSREDSSILSCGGKLSADAVIRLNFIPTASFFARIDIWLQEPKLPKEAFGGDRAHQLFMAIRGNSYYIDRSTTVYRIASEGSMMESWGKSRAARLRAIQSYVSLYEYFDEYTNGRYRTSTKSFDDDKRLSLMFATGERGILSRKDAVQAAKARGVKWLFLLLLFYCSPAIVKLIWEGRFKA
ncbi:glycosyltransferase [Paraeggerthella hongkongensis]|nr:glycosyltransferase [Paraeggerthella hongkongensis]